MSQGRVFLGTITAFILTLGLVYVLPTCIGVVLFLASGVNISTDNINTYNVWFLIPLLVVNLHFTSFVDVKYRGVTKRIRRAGINMFMLVLSWLITFTLWKKIGDPITWKQAILVVLASRAAVTGRHIALLITGLAAADQPTIRKIREKYQRWLTYKLHLSYKRWYMEGHRDGRRQEEKQSKGEEKPPFLRRVS